MRRHEAAKTSPAAASTGMQGGFSSMENDFLQTLIGQMSMAFSLARSSSGSSASAATAAKSCQELGMCLESMGSTRIDAVLVAIER